MARSFVGKETPMSVMRLPRTRHFSVLRFAYLHDGTKEHLALRKINEGQDAVSLVYIGVAAPAKLIERIDVCHNLFHAAIIPQR